MSIIKDFVVLKLEQVDCKVKFWRKHKVIGTAILLVGTYVAIRNIVTLHRSAKKAITEIVESQEKIDKDIAEANTSEDDLEFLDLDEEDDYDEESLMKKAVSWDEDL
jgi:hypothetical protein